uniref:Caspase-3 n=1 Tax=Gasterosteus aculeatus aculeatus TaxID=481459 RepID=A0AAQ4QBA7_GASAC
MFCVSAFTKCLSHVLTVYACRIMDKLHRDVPSGEDKYRYKMDYPCMGTCVIINNKTFDPKTGLSPRNGTDVDAAELEKTFSRLGYKVTVANDQTADQMVDLLADVSKQDHRKSASFVCALLSHGDEDGIYGTDGVSMMPKNTITCQAHACRSLKACRGTDTDRGVNFDADSTDGQMLQSIPLEADFLYAYSTPSGYYSWRNTQNGSCFMQSLCEILHSFSQLELMQIMTRVNYEVALHFESSSDKLGYSGKKQIPCIMSMLTKDFYFPKISD